MHRTTSDQDHRLNGEENGRARTDRGPNGQFVNGNPGGPGRPRREIESTYLRALRDSVSISDWKDVVRSAVKEAKTGDARAREWLSKYLVDPGSETLIGISARDILRESDEQVIRMRADSLRAAHLHEILFEDPIKAILTDAEYDEHGYVYYVQADEDRVSNSDRNDV